VSCRRSDLASSRGLTEWKNRKEQRHCRRGGLKPLADATISHFTSQLGAVDKAIALTIDNDCDPAIENAIFC